MSELDTIAAVSTAPGRSALAVVRVSGPGSKKIAGRLGLPELAPRRAVYVSLKHPDDGRTVDKVVAVRLEAPSSYTGEDMLELSCHGGSLVPQLVLDATCAAGARLAEPGEFTRRAFLNGRLDLLQAEGTLDLIDARARATHRAALFQVERGLSRHIEELRTALIELQALLAYDIDFPDEDDGTIDPERIEESAAQLERRLRRILELAPEGELLRDGALTVIAGRPNVGKSSIFNSLLGVERAIVTHAPGTTRDAIEATVSIEGYPFRFVDTAGIREEAEAIEGLGIEVAHRYLGKADVILMCVEADREAEADEVEFEDRYSRAHLLVVRTKADLVKPLDRVEEGSEPGNSRRELFVSAHTGDGVPELRRALLDAVFSGVRATEEVPLVTRARQVRCLERAVQHMARFRRVRAKGVPSEVAATHLQDATLALEDLLGTVSTDDVLSAVFSDFCVGK